MNTEHTRISRNGTGRASGKVSEYIHQEILLASVLQTNQRNYKIYPVPVLHHISNGCIENLGAQTTETSPAAFIATVIFMIFFTQHTHPSASSKQPMAVTQL